MIALNVEPVSEDDCREFIYTLTKEKEEAEITPSQFGVAEIKLLDNGWVKLTRHDTGIECFPPNRVVALELDPFPRVVSDRPSDG
jgi:hypothetical protein